MKLKINQVWTPVSPRVKVDSVWHPLVSRWVKINGVWEEF